MSVVEPEVVATEAEVVPAEPVLPPEVNQAPADVQPEPVVPAEPEVEVAPMPTLEELLIALDPTYRPGITPARRYSVVTDGRGLPVRVDFASPR